MTRIAGFELIARECNHAALFVTLTCPSRMHAYRTTEGGRVESNPRHDGTRPDEAQRYLSAQWAKFRAAADRRKLGIYGFRIAEPNHDATPHWHCLLFVPELVQRGPASVEGQRALEVGGGVLAVQLLRRYFLDAADPNEPGAHRHRVKVEVIDWTKGGAAKYISKYVSKNIDGYKVERDLYGNDCLTASQRVDAWASTWRIRQFQQIGGAPVTVWRELRRLHPEQGVHSQALAQVLGAVNGSAWQAAHAVESEAVERYTAANGWRDYLRAQGGHRVPRRALRIRVMREATGEVGRYGEPMAPAVVGVQIAERIIERRPALGIVPAMSVARDVLEQVESERSSWIVVTKGAAPPQATQARGEALRPWSPVNNCTQPPAPLFEAAVRRRRKVGRWADWSRFRTGKGMQKGTDHDPPSAP